MRNENIKGDKEKGKDIKGNGKRGRGEEKIRDR